MVPVTVLSGFLGAGKTTLLSHIINNVRGLRIGLIVNDMSSVNIDAALIKSGKAALSRVEGKVVELSNGCICCTLREDLLREMISLASSGRFDYIIIESSGISEPMPVAEIFTFADMSTGKRLGDVAYLDTCVTVVDGFSFLRDYGSADLLITRAEAAAKAANQPLQKDAIPGDERTVIEFANVVVLNKTDMMSGPSDVTQLKGIIARLNPDAKIIEASYGHVPIEAIINTKLFKLEAAITAPGWLKELRGTHLPETIEFGISSFVYRARRPFHPTRLYELINGGPVGDANDVLVNHRTSEAENQPMSLVPPPTSPFENLLRSKGTFWLACDGGMDDSGIWSQAGRVFQFSCGQPWYANMPQEDWGLELNEKNAVVKAWDPTYGDRHQEIVFIGVGLDRTKLEAALQQALVTEEEYAVGPLIWQDYDDPFDIFPFEGTDDSDEDLTNEDSNTEPAASSTVTPLTRMVTRSMAAAQSEKVTNHAITGIGPASGEENEDEAGEEEGEEQEPRGQITRIIRPLTIPELAKQVKRK